MNQRETFLQCLELDEDDPVRCAYADWLEERGEHEESARQRMWPAAKAWLVKFAKEWNFFDAEYGYASGPNYSDGPANPDAFRQMIEQAITVARDCYSGMLVASGVDLHSRHELGGDEALFWQHLETYTGQRFDQNHRESFTWSCSC